MQNLSRSKSNITLPQSFLFGVATADHQCEAYEPEYKDIQDLWEEKRNLEKRGRATDFWNRYAEDINLAKDLGCKLFRFSIAWSRVEPEPRKYNDAAFEHYKKLLETIKEAGMEAVITLHHYTWPIHVEKGGGSVANDFPSIFASYADETARRLGHLVQYWVTFNEPNQLIFGYFKAGSYHLPPGLPPGTSVKEQMEKLRKLIPNLFEAHTRARAAIKQHDPEAKVGTNPFLFGLPPLSRRFIDWQVTSLREEDWFNQGNRLREEYPLWGSDVDLVAAMLSVTSEREKSIDFSEVYYIDTLKLLVPINSSIEGFQDLEGKLVGVIKNSTGAEKIAELLSDSEKRVMNDTRAVVTALAQGQVSALFGDESWLEGIIKQSPGEYKLVGESLGEEYYAVGMPKGHPALQEVVNVAIRRFRDSKALENSVLEHLGTLEKLPEVSSKVIKEVVLANINLEIPSSKEIQSHPWPLAEPGTLLRKIQDRGYIIAGVPENVPGFSTYDLKTQKYKGIEIDLLHTISDVIFADRDRLQCRPIKAKKRISSLCSVFDFLNPLLKSFTTLSSIFNSNWWNLGMAGKLPEFLCPSAYAHQLDFVGFDYYWGTNSFCPDKLIELSNAAQGNYTKAPVWPGGLYKLLKQHAKLFPALEILIIENGCVNTAENIPREEYIRLHVEEIKRAYSEGVKIKGYVCWAITTNKEWGLKFSPSNDFGLYHINLDSDPQLKRIPTRAVEAYRTIIQNR